MIPKLAGMCFWWLGTYHPWSKGTAALPLMLGAFQTRRAGAVLRVFCAQRELIRSVFLWSSGGTLMWNYVYHRRFGIMCIVAISLSKANFIKMYFKFVCKLIHFSSYKIHLIHLRWYLYTLMLKFSNLKFNCEKFEIKYVKSSFTQIKYKASA